MESELNADLVDLQEAIEAIRRGLEQARAGRTVPASDALREIAKRHGIRPV